MTAQRKRDNVQLTNDHILGAKSALKAKGWTQNALAQRAHVHLSTVKRFLNGTPITRELGKEIIEALSLKIDLNQAGTLSLQEADGARSTVQPTHKAHQLTMTATFLSTQRDEVEKVLEHLRTLLLNTRVRFMEDEDTQGLLLQGDIPPDTKLEIKLVLAELETLCSSHHVTWR